MGRLRKRHNWKARSSGNADAPVVNDEDVVHVDINVREEQYDASNALVLPSKKKKGVIKQSKLELKKKPLSKKERKRLEKILERKKKKINRADLLAKLNEVQATPAELEHLVSTSQMQTLGLKRYTSAVKMIENCNGTQINTIKGARKRKFQDPSKKAKDSGDDKQDNESTDSSEADSDVEDACNEVPAHSQSTEVTSGTSIDSHSANAVETTSEENVVMPKPQLKTPDVQTERKCEPAVFVPVNRSPEIQAAREKLPIYSEEQSIMEAIKENKFIIIHGATGSGKTTQIPQFLYEAGYTKNGKMIAITEPRRIAAVSMALRVAEEMNLPHAVSYHIRYERTTADQTEIKFMTDGVLLKEVRQDFLLSRYSVVIIDEAHERSIFSDVLIGLLSRIVNCREKKGDSLKLIIMSATLRLDDFIENRKLFQNKPYLIQVESRQYDVVLHFSKRTPEDYVEAAFKKVCKIHRELPAGGILVFVTGEQEVNSLVKKLRQMFPFHEKNGTFDSDACVNGSKNSVVSQKIQQRKRRKLNKTELPSVNLDNYSAEAVATESTCQLPGEGETEEITADMPSKNFQPLHVLPLYSILPAEQQAKIFKPPPEGSRLCVVATNIAETSITIPGLKYVVDTGKIKTKVYDETRGGISQFVITWTSKASANQRAGRAGRTEGGHCYRLYSSAVFDYDFPAFTLPDIQRTPVDDVLLQMKALGIDRVVNFPFPSPPDIEALKAAEKRLVMLGALQDLQKGQRYKEIKQWEFSAKITQYGKAMSHFPVNPRYAKVLLMAHDNDIISHAISLVSAFTVPELFVPRRVEEENDSEDVKQQWLGVKQIGAGTGSSVKLGDAMVMLRALEAYNYANCKTKFCMKYGVRQKALVEINKMRHQLTREINRNFKNVTVPLPTGDTSEMSLPDEEEVEKLRKILAASLIDRVARKVPVGELGDERRKLKNAYKCLDTDEFVFIHPSSILFDTAPNYVVYQEIFKTSRNFMRGVIEIEPEWIPLIVPNMCEFSPPLEVPAPHYDSDRDKIVCSMTSTFGRWNWEISSARMEMPFGIMKYKWFCYFLLEGKVCPIFVKYKEDLVSSPSNMLKSWAQLLPRIRLLLQAVERKDIDSKAALHKVWEVNPKYLLREYLDWLPEDKHQEVINKWPHDS